MGMLRDGLPSQDSVSGVLPAPRSDLALRAFRGLAMKTQSSFAPAFVADSELFVTDPGELRRFKSLFEQISGPFCDICTVFVF